VRIRDKGRSINSVFTYKKLKESYIYPTFEFAAISFLRIDEKGLQSS
jgi:hypothetical protein